MNRRFVGVAAALLVVWSGLPQTRASDLPEVPTQAGSPWPSMRHDRRNTGRSDIRAVYRTGDRPWAFRTGKGIFSTPVVSADGTAYVGSGDGIFYAIDGRGREAWRLPTQGIIDSAAVLDAYDPAFRSAPITVGSGDGLVYRLRSERKPNGPRVVWTFKAAPPTSAGQVVSWWEGNVVTGFGGVLFAGNTGGGAYAINPDGKQRWVYTTGNAVWTAPAIASDNTTYWGSLDLFVYALDANGQMLWRTPTVGFVASSPALGNDGTLYVGSFDGKLYALDAKLGIPKWAFTAADHIYSSPALSEDAANNTTAIYVGSADGSVYAISPSGAQLWRYDTGDPVRSSPAVGRAPSGSGEIVYVGSANGRLYALDARTGRRRWSFDTTPGSDPILRDRNDLNGSPALGPRGVFIGGEHGFLWHVPYDYCVRVSDSRCSVDSGQEFGDDLTRVYFVTAGGNTEKRAIRATIPAATLFNTRLVVRRGGGTVDAGMLALSPALPAEDMVRASPPFDFTAGLSGDGHFLFIRPDGFLQPGTDYEIGIVGDYLSGGPRVANWTVGGTALEPFTGTLRFRTAPIGGPLTLAVGRNEVTALRLRRLAVPLPPFLPSVNAIGFDGYEWLAGTIAKTPPGATGEGSVLLWVIGGKRDARGTWIADPASEFSFPMAGRYRGDDLILSQRDLNLPLSFGVVPLRVFELRGQLSRALEMRSGASLYAEATCSTMPNYGPALYLAGICNKEDTVIASGTFVTTAYDRSGPANKRPAGLAVRAVSFGRPSAIEDGSVVATLSLAPGASYPADRHVVSILLTDDATGAPLSLDYRANTGTTTSRGNVSEVRLLIPKGTSLPDAVKVTVIADVFPLSTWLF